MSKKTVRDVIKLLNVTLEILVIANAMALA
jgi:hypothetical protein